MATKPNVYVKPDSVLARTASEVVAAHSGGPLPDGGPASCPQCGEPLPCSAGRAAAEVLAAAGLAQSSGLVDAARQGRGPALGAALGPAAPDPATTVSSGLYAAASSATASSATASSAITSFGPVVAGLVLPGPVVPNPDSAGPQAGGSAPDPGPLPGLGQSDRSPESGRSPFGQQPARPSGDPAPFSRPGDPSGPPRVQRPPLEPPQFAQPNRPPLSPPSSDRPPLEPPPSGRAPLEPPPSAGRPALQSPQFAQPRPLVGVGQPAAFLAAEQADAPHHPAADGWTVLPSLQPPPPDGGPASVPVSGQPTERHPSASQWSAAGQDSPPSGLPPLSDHYGPHSGPHSGDPAAT